MLPELRFSLLVIAALLAWGRPWPIVLGLEASYGSPAHGAADSITVVQCVERARSAAPAVREAGLAASSAVRQSEAAAMNGAPIFKLFGDVLVAPRGFYDPAITNLGQYDLRAGVEWPLRDGGARSRSRLRSANEAAASRLGLEEARRESAGRAAELAIEILRIQERQAVETEGLEWLGGLLRLVRPAVASGGRGAGDVLRVELERDGLDAALRATQVDRAAAQRELAGLIGLPEDSLPVIRGPAPGFDPPPAEAESSLAARQISKLPSVRLANFSTNQLELDLEDLRSQNKLQLTASADAGLGGTDLTAAVPGDLKAADPGANFLDRLHRDLGASVKIEFSRVLSDRTVPLALEARQLGIAAAEMHARAEGASQLRLVRDLWGRRRSAHARRLALQDVTARAEENLLRSKSLYAAGSLTLLELLDARRLAEDSRERGADALAEERKSRLALEARQ